MDHKQTEERTKPFRLVKYFTFTGLIMIFIVTLILSVVNTQLVRSMQRQNSEEYAHVLIENLNHQMFVQFIVPVALLSIVSLYIGFGAEHIQELSARIADELVNSQGYIDAVLKSKN